MSVWLWLAVGSIAGGFSRYLLAGAIHRSLGTQFPFGTVTVNMIGCFLIGLFNALAEYKFKLGPQGRILLMTGFCGAFTTFSAFILETLNLLKGGQLGLASVNVVGSVVLGCVLFYLAEILVKTI